MAIAQSDKEADPHSHLQESEPDRLTLGPSCRIRRQPIRPDLNFTSKSVANSISFVMFFCICSLVGSTSAVLNIVPPVVWNKLDKNVINGTTLVTYNLHFESPRSVCGKFGTMSDEGRQIFLEWCDN